MNDLSLLAKEAKQSKENNRHVVRLTTSYFTTNRGVSFRRDLNTLKRKSYGYLILEEEASMIDAQEAIEKIINLHSCEDGLYTVVMINPSYDVESGIIDDYDIMLIPYEEKNEN